MIDLWEMMGHFVMNDNFRRKLFVSFKTGSIYKVDKTYRAYIPNDYSTVSTAHPSDDYDAIRRIARHYVGNKPYSLMALGTMLFSLTFQNFRDLADKVAEMLEGLLDEMDVDPTDDGFYIALGALIVDQNLIVELTTHNNWSEWGFGFVHRRDRRILTKLFDQNQNMKFSNAVHDFCYTQWGSECDVSAVEWPLHMHPVTPANAPSVVYDK